MLNQRTFVATLMATTLLTAGIAVAAKQQDSGTAAPQLTKTEQDFGKLSTDGARASQGIALTRLAIFEGHTDQAKKYIGEAEAALKRAKGDEANFVKADETMTQPTEGSQAKLNSASSEQGAAKGQAWLPVDGVITLDEDYSANPAKAKAVAEANEHLRKGDRKAAVERLKIADVGLSVVQEVLPLQETITAVHQASSLINEGKFYEGSQELRKIQASARFDVATYVAGSGGKVTYSHMSDVKALAAGQTATEAQSVGKQGASQQNSGQQNSAAVLPNGPEPYSAPDPQYSPMTKEPVLPTPQPSRVSLDNGPPVNGPAAGPEPYSAPDPQYKPMTKEPVFNAPK